MNSCDHFHMNSCGIDCMSYFKKTYSWHSWGCLKVIWEQRTIFTYILIRNKLWNWSRCLFFPSYLSLYCLFLVHVNEDLFLFPLTHMILGGPYLCGQPPRILRGQPHARTCILIQVKGSPLPEAYPLYSGYRRGNSQVTPLVCPSWPFCHSSLHHF